MGGRTQGTSAVWEYFTSIQRNEKEFLKCSLCFAELASHTAANLKTHIRTRHSARDSRPPGAPTLIEIINELDKASNRPVPKQLQNEVDELERQVRES